MERETGYITLLKKRESKKENLRQAALKESERLAALLRENFEFEALYLIGSVVRERRFQPHSDIDLVVKGLRRESFFKALAFLIRSSVFPVDLKPWEELDAVGKARVKEKGRVLP